MLLYKIKRTLSEHIKITDCLFVSRFNGLNLKDYLTARNIICTRKHRKPCKECPGMCLAAKKVLDNGFVCLRSAYTESFPDVSYNVCHARRRFLQMPLACIHVNGVRENFRNKLFSISRGISTCSQKN